MKYLAFSWEIAFFKFNFIFLRKFATFCNHLEYFCIYFISETFLYWALARPSRSLVASQLFWSSARDSRVSRAACAELTSVSVGRGEFVKAATAARHPAPNRWVLSLLTAEAHFYRLRRPGLRRGGTGMVCVVLGGENYSSRRLQCWLLRCAFWSRFLFTFCF